LKDAALVDGLIAEHPSQANRSRGGENVTVMRCNVGRAGRSDAYRSVNTVTPASLWAPLNVVGSAALLAVREMTCKTKPPPKQGV
jgi:hypothetical protein